MITFFDDENNTWPCIEHCCIQLAVKITTEFLSHMYYVSFRRPPETVTHPAGVDKNVSRHRKDTLKIVLGKLESTEW
jgi:hypothetical protein